MARTKESLTALVSCFSRGYHASSNSQPIFNDQVAFSLLHDEEKQVISTNWANAISFFDPEKSESLKTFNEKLGWVMNNQTVPQLVSRARYAEDGLIAAIERGVKQYVILGAGLILLPCGRKTYQKILSSMKSTTPQPKHSNAPASKKWVLTFLTT